MNSLELKYGCNPNQKPARIFMADGSAATRDGALRHAGLRMRPPRRPQLLAARARAAQKATGMPAAAWFKRGLACRRRSGDAALSEEDKKAFFVDDEGELTPIACAYIRARGADRMSSFGDWAALSDTCDGAATALYLKHEVSDGIIPPGYTPEALEYRCAPRSTASTTWSRLTPTTSAPPSSARTSLVSPSSRDTTSRRLTTTFSATW